MPAQVSVVIPFYQQVEFAAETVGSVLAQDLPGLEVILADDASTDGTAELLEGLAARDERLRLLRAPVNVGIAANLNAGIAAATGELVAILGGDDLMLPGKLRAQVQALRDHPRAIGHVHDAEVFESDSGRVLGRFSQLYNGRPGVRPGGVELQFDPTYFMLPSTMMFRRSVAPAGGYDTRLRFANDWLWAVELLRAGSLVASDDVLVRYRRHAGNITSSPETRTKILEEGLVALAIVEARHPEMHRLVRRRAAGFGLAATREALGARQWALSVRRARQTLAWGGARATVSTACAMVLTRRRRGGDPPS